MKVLAIVLLLVVVTGALARRQRDVKSGEEKKKKSSSSAERFIDHAHWEHHGTDSRKYAETMLDYFVKNPVTKRELECFETTLQSGDSIDFVVDVAPSPSLDEFDKLCANSPIGRYLEETRPQSYPRSISRTFFDQIALFIDIVSYGMKPEATHTVIVELSSEKKPSKYFLRGREMNESLDVSKLGGEFMDSVRNLKTLWPVSSKAKPEDNKLAKIFTNNLGRMTKLALWNRDNGLPTVLAAKRHSKPVYTIVITDGASRCKINDLVDDLSRTTVIDMGNHRFVDELKWHDYERIGGGVYTLTAPQTLLAFANSVRNMACQFSSNRKNGQSLEQESSQL